LTTFPPIEIVPLVIFSSPATIRNVVDFPHPEGPTNTMNSPSLISKLMLLTAVNVARPRSSVYVLTKLLIFTEASLLFIAFRCYADAR
jgi:hypothetical protein